LSESLGSIDVQDPDPLPADIDGIAFDDDDAPAVDSFGFGLLRQYQEDRDKSAGDDGNDEDDRPATAGLGGSASHPNLHRLRLLASA
jgi:hypothetical protein